MIRLWDTYGCLYIWVNPNSIDRIEDRPTSHGAKCLIRFNNGKKVYVSDAPEAVLRAIANGKND